MVWCGMVRYGICMVSALLAQIHNQNRSYRFSYGISTEAGEEKTGLRIFVTKKMTAWHPFLTLK
jgi:hypothetical protein